ncbi:hypothetical protein Tco_0005797 [Tanacetum coccineum]
MKSKNDATEKSRIPYELPDNETHQNIFWQRVGACFSSQFLEDTAEFFEEENETNKKHDEWSGDQGYNENGMMQVVASVNHSMFRISWGWTDNGKWFQKRGGARRGFANSDAFRFLLPGVVEPSEEVQVKAHVSELDQSPVDEEQGQVTADKSGKPFEYLKSQVTANGSETCEKSNLR